MRTLLLFRGAPGVGKSTYIEKNGLKPYALCADDIRLLCQSPILSVNGNTEITMNNDRVVWKTLFTLLEVRMQRGEFTVIDATNSKTSEMKQYKKLCQEYRYRIFLIDFSDVPIEECKRRNNLRAVMKQVPEAVIDKMYSRFKTQGIPSGITVIKPEELDKVFMKKIDLSEYKAIHHVGDAHGAMHPLSEYIRTMYFGFNYDIPEYWRTERWLNLKDFSGEKWVDIEDYEELYQISNYGRLKSLSKIQRGLKKSESIYIFRINVNGYLYANLSKHSKKKTFYVHKLVAKHFGINIECEINHIDGVKQNNNIKNLEYSDRIENEQHCWKTGIKKGREVLQYDNEKNLISSYDTAKEAALLTNTYYSSIIQCCNGRISTSNGYIWKYKDKKEFNTSGKPIPVEQYDLNGAFIKKFSSIKEAEKEIGVQTIRRCLSGKLKTAGGYIWKCADYDYEAKEENNYKLSSEYLSKLIKDDEMYIFAGDYIDRGIENAEVIQFLLSIKDKPNVLLLEGNHEIHLRRYSEDKKSFSKEFELFTKPALDKAGFNKKDLRQLCRKFAQCAYYTYHGNTYLVTHGGLSTIPQNLAFVATDQMIHGVGKYNDVEQVANTFFDTTDEHTYQIFGHRNTKGFDINVNPRVYDLEGQVEFGGCLRCVDIVPGGSITYEIKNNVFREPEKSARTMSNNVSDALIELRYNKYITEKQFGNISSFNFSPAAFQKNIWDEQTIKARGLFLDTEKFKIVARSYEKFFNINQREETKLDALQRTLQFPVAAYVKENGFLGIVSWNEYTDDLFITSKSDPEGKFSEWLRDMVYTKISKENLEKMKKYIKENDVSFVFECCDMEHDPHIIDYPESKLVLLDIVYNTLEFQKYNYEDMAHVGRDLGLTIKKQAYELSTWQEFYDWYFEVLE